MLKNILNIYIFPTLKFRFIVSAECLHCNTYVPTQLSMLAHAGGLKSPERCLRCPIGALAGNKSVKKHHEYVNIDHPKANGRRAGAYPGVTAQMFDWMWDRGGKWWSPDTLSLCVCERENSAGISVSQPGKPSLLLVLIRLSTAVVGKSATIQGIAFSLLLFARG